MNTQVILKDVVLTRILTFRPVILIDHDLDLCNAFIIRH